MFVFLMVIILVALTGVIGSFVATTAPTFTATAAGTDDYSLHFHLANRADLSIQADVNQIAGTEGDHVNGLTVQIRDFNTV